MSGPVDPDVFAGRDPAWRVAWENELDPTSREEVARAVREGVRIADTRLEPFVYGLIARRRRQNRWRAPGRGRPDVQFSLDLRHDGGPA